MNLTNQLPGLAYRCRCDRHWTVLFASAGARELTGYAPEALVENRDVAYAELIHPDDRERIRERVEQAIEGGTRYEIEYRIRSRSGELKWVWEQGRAAEADGERVLDAFVIDVTPRKALEERLQRVERLEAVGRLAGGIAHDFNNLLTAIGGYADIAHESLEEGHECREDLRKIREAARRGTAMTRRLLAFSRRQALEPRRVEIDAVIAGVEQLLEQVLGPEVELILRPGADGGWVEVDPEQMERVLMNLAINARDAIPDRGRLTIETATVDLDADYAGAHPRAVPGPYVLVAVSDTGLGMSDAVQERIFEPFFTTKEEGTGLGLATVYGVVKQSGGFVWVYSEEGQGTTFKIHLPRVQAPDGRGRPAGDDAEPERRRVTVLVADDDDVVRNVIVQSLRQAGYEVLQAASGEEALAAFRDHPEPVDVLIVDLVLGDRDGVALARELQEGAPDLRVLVVSGYTREGSGRGDEVPPGTAFLSKPLSPSKLRQRVQELLGLTVSADG